jgi:hypothetical protein
LFLEHDDHEVAHGNLDELAADNASESYMLQEVSNSATVFQVSRTALTDIRSQTPMQNIGIK